MRVTSALPLLALAVSAACECNCGYSSSEHSAVFTELIETNFLHIENIQSDWVAQAYNVTPDDARGPFGKAAQVENVESNTLSSPFDWSGFGPKGPNPGLQLWARASLIDIPGNEGRMIPMAEVVSARNDILYGSFRVGMMTTKVNGTCGAFFFYRNDTEEIDMEFLSRQQRQESGFVNLVIQSPSSAELGYVNSSSPDFDDHHLVFAPGTGYNEYRFDWLPDRIDFFANGELLSSATENVPDAAGSLHLIHWSNGNAGWSGGPPEEDAALTISYVKAYFNSSNSDVTQKSQQNCKPGGNSCEIPTQKIPPNPLGANGNETGKTFFFTDQNEDQTTSPIAPSPTASKSARTTVVWINLLGVVAWLLLVDA